MSIRAVATLFACVLCASGGVHAQGYSVVTGGGAGTPSVDAGDAPDAPESAQTGQGRGAVVARRGARTEPRRDDGYGGVVPGNGQHPPGLPRRAVDGTRSGRIVVAWPGFQVTPQGSRIFLAVTAQPTITTHRTPGQIVYRLAGATVPVRNNLRPLVTEAFATPVRRASLRQRGRDVDLVVELRAEVEPQLSQQTNPQGLDFVYLDFGPWSPPSGPSGTTAPPTRP